VDDVVAAHAAFGLGGAVRRTEDFCGVIVAARSVRGAASARIHLRSLEY